MPGVKRHRLPRTHGAVRDGGVGADGDGTGDAVSVDSGVKLNQRVHQAIQKRWTFS